MAGEQPTTTAPNTTTATTDHAPAPPYEPTSPRIDHEAILTGVIALAVLFSNCVEAFGLIHPSTKWEKNEQVLLTRLGVQQARLLIWGDVTGVSSPPATVTDRAIPKHPNAAYPDIKEPTFFGMRDERLDDMETRKTVEAALASIADRTAGTSREEMMLKYGLKPPKKFAGEHQQALDMSRLEAFRERYELLQEVAESYAQISTARNSSITRTAWSIADLGKFNGFIKLTQEKVDLLIDLMDVKEKVDRGMRMDIKGLGWHLSADRQRIASDVSKLRLIADACRDEYPEYIPATQTALENIDRERRENTISYNPYAAALAVPVVTAQDFPSARRGSIPLAHASHDHHAANGSADAKPAHHAPGLFGGLFKFGRSKSQQHAVINAGRSQSVSAVVPSSTHHDTLAPDDDPVRALSHPGHVRNDSETSDLDLEPTRSKSVGAILETPAEAVRSKSVGDVLHVQPENEEEAEVLRSRLERLDTNATVPDDEAPVPGDGVDDGDAGVGALENAPSRHDQYHGLGRQGTRTQD